MNRFFQSILFDLNVKYLSDVRSPLRWQLKYFFTSSIRYIDFQVTPDSKISSAKLRFLESNLLFYCPFHYITFLIPK